MVRRHSVKRIQSKPIKDLGEICTDETALKILQAKAMELFNRKLPAKRQFVYFYIYFPSQQKAEAAEAELYKDFFGKEASFEVEVIEPLEGRKEWLCLAAKEIFPNASTLSSIRRRLENLARKYDGFYDGWEMEIPNSEAEGFL